MAIDLNIDDCAHFPLHKIGETQSHGFILVVNHAHICVGCSENFLDQFNLTPEQVLQADLTNCLATAGLRTDDKLSSQDLELGTYLDFTLHGKNEQYFGYLHATKNNTILEFEALSPALGQESANTPELDTIAFVAQLSHAENENKSAEELLTLVTKATGFERCLFYRFLPNGQGEVIAEHLNADVKSYLHHRFPAGDIPANARHLYVQNPVRLIPDVNAKTSELLSVESASDLDLTWSRLRAVHPVHLTYLRQMDVAASFSLSIVVNGDLWGLISCHHRTAKGLPLQTVKRLQEYLSITSLHIQHLQIRRVDRATQQAKSALTELRELYQLSSPSEMETAIAHCLLPELERLMVDGCLIELAGGSYRFGDLPGDQSLHQLFSWLSSTNNHDLPYNELPVPLRDNDELKRLASGLLGFPLQDRGHLWFFRKEQCEKLVWAGQPPSLEDQHEHLSPRASFASWVEETAYTSRPWFVDEQAALDVVRQEMDRWLQSKDFADLALKDPLTGLANRNHFESYMQKALEHSEQGEPNKLIMYFSDLDGFKPINDTYGHLVGDELLRVIALRLKNNLRKQDLVARLGGDEFVIIQTGQIPEAAISRTAAQIKELISNPVRLDDKNLMLGVSLGIARYPQEATDLNSLLQLADERMYAEKKKAKTSLQINT